MTVVTFQTITFWRFVAECFFPELAEQRLARVRAIERHFRTTIEDDLRFEVESRPL